MLLSLLKFQSLLKRNYIKVKSLFFLFSLLLLFSTALLVILEDSKCSTATCNKNLNTTNNIQYLRNNNINSRELDTEPIEKTMNPN